MREKFLIVISLLSAGAQDAASQARQLIALARPSLGDNKTRESPFRDSERF
jgi:hypothetical protein